MSSVPDARPSRHVIAKTRRRVPACDLSSSPGNSTSTSIEWEGEAYDLPREMLWELPAKYLVRNFADATGPTYDGRETIPDMETELQGVLKWMEQGQSSNQGRWTSNRMADDVSLVIPLLMPDLRFLR